jgi:hypothetical protein
MAKFATVRRAYGSSTATTNDLAHFDVPSDAVLIGIDFSMSVLTSTAGDRVRLEAATSSVCQATTNDCNGVLGNADYNPLATSSQNAATNKWLGPLNIFIPKGSRIYIHTIQAGTSATQCTVNFHLVYT